MLGLTTAREPEALHVLGVVNQGAGVDNGQGAISLLCQLRLIPAHTNVGQCGEFNLYCLLLFHKRLDLNQLNVCCTGELPKKHVSSES